MSIAIGEEHAHLASTARRWLENRCPPEVARAGLDAEGETEALPPFWPELAAMGWLGLHVDEAFGGQGYGLAETAVVVEEMGRAAAPGPYLPTVIASALLSAGGSDATRKEWLPGLADGTRVGAVALPPSGRLELTGATVTGRLCAVLSAGLADVLIATAEQGWISIPLDAATVTVTVRQSLDPTRRVADVDLSGARCERLEIDSAEADGIVATLVAAECAGGAGWCVDAAAAYAKVREQFGRPIGQFQAVKHKLADMLILTEEIRAAAWDAAMTGSVLAAAVAGAVGPANFLKVAEDCIQLHGGIGFTWEHDAHRYLRRAATLVALSQARATWCQRTAQLATEGVRSGGSGDLLAGQDDLRSSVRAEVERVAALAKEERRRALVDSGLFVPHWPPPWGRSAGAVEQLIIDEELDRARVRRANLAVGAWAAPTIVSHGTTEQQERFVGPTLTGEIKWCQLFSEPGAGSDLASLRTRATKVDGGWRLDGQKVWTSMATDADYGICLARTNPDAPKHLGITYFVVDMKEPGIDIRPLRELTGLAMFNEVFLEGVFVPDDQVIGPVDGGWALARTTLANERVAMGSGASFGGGMEALLSLVADLPPLDDAATVSLGWLVAESHCLSVLGRRSAHRAVAGAPPGPEASVRKLLGAEHDQRTQEFGLALLGPEGATTEGRGAQWTFGFLANRCLTIAGGTSEVQRNVIAERLLGLPRDPG